jgi:hypothetical protein
MIHHRLFKSSRRQICVALLVLSALALLILFNIARGRKNNYTIDNTRADPPIAIDIYDPAHPCGVVSATLVTHLLS